MPEPSLSEYKRLVGLRYRACRLSAGYETAREFAALLGVEENTLTKWERGDSFPQEVYLPVFQRITRVPIGFLYTGDLSDVPLALARKLEGLLPAEAVRTAVA